MIPWSTAYTASRVASGRGTVTGRDAGSDTGGWGTPREVGQLTTGRLAVTDPAVADEAPAASGPADPGADCPGADCPGAADVVFTAGPPQLATSASGTAASSARAIGPRHRRPC